MSTKKITLARVLARLEEVSAAATGRAGEAIWHNSFNKVAPISALTGPKKVHLKHATGGILSSHPDTHAAMTAYSALSPNMQRGVKIVKEDLDEGRMAELDDAIKTHVTPHIKAFKSGKMGADTFGSKIADAHKKISDELGHPIEVIKQFVNQHVDRSLGESQEKLVNFSSWLVENAGDPAHTRLVSTYTVSPKETLKLFAYKAHHYLYHYIDGKPNKRLASLFTGHSDDSIKDYLKQHHDLG